MVWLGYLTGITGKSQRKYIPATHEFLPFYLAS
jgi:hypothetical protein